MGKLKLKRHFAKLMKNTKPLKITVQKQSRLWVILGVILSLVTAFGQLEAQPELKNKLAQYTVSQSADGFIVYDLNHPLPEEE
jgi:hypothetical protein